MSPPQPPTFLSSQTAAEEIQLPCFISFPSAKDVEYNSRCPGKSTAVVVSDSREEYFNAGPVNKRGEAYDDVKAKYKTALTNAFLRHFPHLKSKISYVDIGTPASNVHYLGRAASLGLDPDSDRLLRDQDLSISVRGIKGLFLTGQDIFTAGIFCQPFTAWMTLSKMLGPMSLDFWLLLGDFMWAVIRRSVFSPGPTHPGVREMCRWAFCK